MGNIVRSLILCIFSSFLTAGQVAAQNQQLKAPSVNISSLTAEDVRQIFVASGFDARIVNEQGAEMVIATTEGGGAVYAAPRSCSAAGCSVLETFAFVSASNTTLGQLNEFHALKTIKSIAMLRADGAAVIASKIFLANGGVSAGNLQYQLALFFFDLNNAVTALSRDVHEVKFKPSSQPKRLGGSDGYAHALVRAPIVNPIGANAPDFMTDQFRKSLNF